jgi:hypothetical protein
MLSATRTAPRAANARRQEALVTGSWGGPPQGGGRGRPQRATGIEQAAHDALDAFDGDQTVVQRAAEFLKIWTLHQRAAQELQIAEDRRERIIDLVRHAGGKLPERAQTFGAYQRGLRLSQLLCALFDARLELTFE